LVLISTLGITFSMFGRCHASSGIDVALRCLLAALSFVVMFYPDMTVSAAFAVVVAAALAVAIWQHGKIAPPKTFSTDIPAASSGDLSPVLAQAKRDLG
jgi:hypothetical protein